ncbi:MAG TPA: TPM domain-containing protein [Steroidobacteraceae bacterium]|nr:TPM domain-containing protein [Steroidobacteraceae bacterium]
MNAKRLIRHLFATQRGVRTAFTRTVLDAIENAIRASEATHAGEIRFVIEGALHPVPIWRGVSAAERAKRVFAEFDVWDTAANSGVLIYVLMADRAVEIVADRGFAGRVDPSEWGAACRAIETEFPRGRYREGAVAGVEAVGRLIARHFPAPQGNPNELADRPVVR